MQITWIHSATARPSTSTHSLGALSLLGRPTQDSNLEPQARFRCLRLPAWLSACLWQSRSQPLTLSAHRCSPLSPTPDGTSPQTACCSVQRLIAFGSSNRPRWMHAMKRASYDPQRKYLMTTHPHGLLCCAMFKVVLEQNQSSSTLVTRPTALPPALHYYWLGTAPAPQGHSASP